MRELIEAGERLKAAVDARRAEMGASYSFCCLLFQPRDRKWTARASIDLRDTTAANADLAEAVTDCINSLPRRWDAATVAATIGAEIAA